MPSPNPAEESWPTDLPGLTARLAELAEEGKALEARLRVLAAAERPEEGLYFARELHAMRQEKIMLCYKQECCRARLGRLRLVENGA